MTMFDILSSLVIASVAVVAQVWISALLAASFDSVAPSYTLPPGVLPPVVTLAPVLMVLFANTLGTKPMTM